MFRYILTVALVTYLTGCKEEKPDPLRLDHSVEPLSQLVALSLDPDQDSYFGSTETLIKINRKMDGFRIHGRDLGIKKVRIKSEKVDEQLTFTEGEKGTLTLRSPVELDPGEYSLLISFTNNFSRQGTGIYKVEYEGRNYLFTQMEPEYARNSFPCWDAPQFKIPWELQLVIPSNYTAYANTPVRSERLRVGMKEICFEQTKPMPSYLTALAVGHFEEVEVPGYSVTGRIIVPAGKTDLAAEAAHLSPPLLKQLEDYFGRPYPYRKLDQIAVPEFNYGAMENVGLITYRDTILLLDSNAVSLEQKQWLALIVAHEMSHMWFGNLVTPMWWDDLWLNESFASWIALKMVNRTFPEYEMHNHDIQSRQRAIDTDSLSTTRAIRRPIPASDAMTHLFDALAYNKGMAVLDMVEDWMGEECFRQGMVHYMNDFAWGNANAFDLADSLSRTVDSDVLAVMKSFVTEPGIPMLEFERLDHDRIRITQERYAHLGVVPEERPVWPVPVVIRLYDGSVQKFLLTRRSQIVQLTGQTRGFYPNANEKGYYRWALTPELMKELSKEIRSMETRNRLGFLSNLSALFSAGAIDAPSYLEITASFSTDPSPEVRRSVVHHLTGFADGLIPPDLMESYGEFLASVLKPMLEEIGTEKKDGENALVEQLRPALINALGWRCRDPEILNLASRKAEAYMKNPYDVDPALTQPYLRLAALGGDKSLFDMYQTRFESATAPIEKQNYLSGISGFRDPALMERALDYALSDAVAPHQFKTIPNSLTDNDTCRRLVFDWLKKNYPVVQEKIPTHSQSYLPWLACGQSLELLQEAREFFLAEGIKTQGIELELEKATAVVGLHARLRDKELENIRVYLNAR